MARLGVIVASSALLVVTADVRAEAEARGDHTIVAGLGAAGERALDHAEHAVGANLMLEWEAIDGWLELELDVSWLATRAGSELPLDLLVKKPFPIAGALEGMVGLGPEISRTISGPGPSTRYGIEAALDLMYWITPRVGAWVEPSYGLELRDRTSTLALTMGIMIGW